MDVFVARQPIFRANKKLFAYELLFRTGMSNAFPGIDGGTATSSLLSSSFFTVGIERISSGKLVFINFTEELLLRGIPTLFPHNQVVVEILEDVKPTNEVIAACQALHQKGYILALDDFIFHENLQPLIEIAKIIKIDFRLTPLAEISKMLLQLKDAPCEFLAEKIETHEEFMEAKALGFSYFQGYFFAKPEILRNKDISSSQLTIMQLICEVNRAECDIKKLEALINQDVSISYKLINYLNSAYYSRLQPVSSIRQAIAYLGERGIRMFISLIAASRLVDNKPDELLRASAIRARFLEQIAIELDIDSGELFMLGLFSMLDAMLDNSMEYIVGQLPLSGQMSEALVKRGGTLSPFLRLAENFEAGNWSDLDSQIAIMKISSAKLQDFYLNAVKLADLF
ncbi:MAG: HDOD domain-containing protein [Proteobacteria bacterium]|nr:HDOD domain-containing protein [Pseudomonadota bacterium]